jgi:hypothetical protein
LNSCCFDHGDVTWDCSKEGVLENKRAFRQKVLGKIKRSCKYLLVENHKSCLDKLQILLVVLGFFSTEHGILLYFDLYLTIVQRCINFYNECYVHIVV